MKEKDLLTFILSLALVLMLISLLLKDSIELQWLRITLKIMALIFIFLSLFPNKLTKLLAKIKK